MVSLRNRSQVGGQGGGDLTSTITLPKPTGTVNGDYMYAIHSVGYGTNALTLTSEPAGWTLLYASGPISNGTSFDYIWVYGKIAAGEPANWSWGFSAQIAFYNCNAVSLSGGVDAATPFEQLSAVSAANQPTGSQLTRSATTGGPNRTLITIMANGVPTGGSSWAENAGTETFETFVGGMGVAFNMLDLPAATTQSVTGTITTTASNAGMAMVQMALVPAVIPVGRSLTLPSAVLNAAGRSTALSYLLLPQVGRSLALPSTLASLVGRSVAQAYSIIAHLGRSLAFLWFTAQATAGRSLVLRWGLGETVAIPGRENSDAYADGAANPFGVALLDTTDLTIFATFFTFWEPPQPEPEIELARLPFAHAQAVYGKQGAIAKSLQPAVCGWHGTAVDPERGSVALVPNGGKLAGLVGRRAQITMREGARPRAVLVYVYAVSAELPSDEDISVSRRLFLALSPLWRDTLDVLVEEVPSK